MPEDSEEAQKGEEAQKSKAGEILAFTSGRKSRALPPPLNSASSLIGFDADAGRMPPLIFLEVNNPMPMTPAEVEEDTAPSGVNPYRRYIFWKRGGFAPLDFPYVQPALRPENSVVRYLDLFCATGVAEAILTEL